MKAVSKWIKCAAVVCLQCAKDHSGRMFAAIRVFIPSGNRNEKKLSPEVYVVPLRDLDRLIKDGNRERLTEVNDRDMFMQARWVVDTGDCTLAFAPKSGRSTVLKPKNSQVYSVCITAISSCRCNLFTEAKEGNLAGIHGDANLPVLSGNETSSSSDNEAFSGVGIRDLHDDYFLKSAQQIEEDFVVDAGSDGVSLTTQVDHTKVCIYYCLGNVAFSAC